MCLRSTPSTTAVSRNGWATMPRTDGSKSANSTLASSRRDS